ncbi:MAG TPA: glycosyltransferase family 2 protein, partial [Nitrososphaeraceae archaeon]
MATQTDELKENVARKNDRLQAVNVPIETTQVVFPKIGVRRVKGWSILKWGLASVVGALFAFRFYQELFVIDPIVGTYSMLVVFLLFTSLAVSFFRYKDPSMAYTNSNETTRSMFKKASIIIPARNEPEIIRKTVAACLSSSYSNIEIILVNDGSTDKTGSVMDSLHRENPDKVKVLHLSSNVGKRRAIREAILQSNLQGEIIILHDSDSIVHENAIERVISVFRDPDVGGVTC